MKLRKLQILPLLLLAFAGCQKVIDFDYNSIDPMVIIQSEFSINAAGALSGYVHLSYSQDVDCEEEVEIVEKASVNIRTPDGYRTPLKFEDGRFVISSVSLGSEEDAEVIAAVGIYTLSVTIDGVEYSAQCDLQPAPTFNEMYFIWQEVMPGMGMILLRASITDTKGESNFYKYSIQVPELYQVGMMRDTGLDGMELEVFIPFIPHESLGYVTSATMLGDAFETISNGQNIQFSCFALDERPYNFLDILGSSTINPPSQFEGALGYFSVYYENTMSVIFHKDGVIEL